MALSAPQLWPDAPSWVWGAAFYIGLALIAAGPIWWVGKKLFVGIPKMRIDWGALFSRADKKPYRSKVVRTLSGGKKNKDAAT